MKTKQITALTPSSFASVLTEMIVSNFAWPPCFMTVLKPHHSGGHLTLLQPWVAPRPTSFELIFPFL